MSRELCVFDKLIELLSSYSKEPEIAEPDPDAVIGAYEGYPVGNIREALQAFHLLKTKKVNIFYLLVMSDIFDDIDPRVALNNYNASLYDKKDKLNMKEYTFLKNILRKEE